MSGPVDSDGDPKAWLDYAERDLGVSMRELNAPNGSVHHVCAHAQQAVEKAIKAVLCHAGIRIPHIHDLPRLVAFLPRELTSDLAGGDLPSLQAHLEQLSQWYLGLRYPHASPVPTRSEAEASVEVAEMAFRWAKRTIDAHSQRK